MCYNYRGDGVGLAAVFIVTAVTGCREASKIKQVRAQKSNAFKIFFNPHPQNYLKNKQKMAKVELTILLISRKG